VTSSHTKKQTVIIAEKEIPEQELKNVVAKVSFQEDIPFLWYGSV
jgi:hypothetical protein